MRRGTRQGPSLNFRSRKCDWGGRNLVLLLLAKVSGVHAVVWVAEEQPAGREDTASRGHSSIDAGTNSQSGKRLKVHRPLLVVNLYRNADFRVKFDFDHQNGKFARVVEVVLPMSSGGEDRSRTPETPRRAGNKALASLKERLAYLRGSEPIAQR
jgi:hypothetical protein